MKGMFKKKKKPDTEMALQITSMADIFTLILVFLLKSSGSGINSISPTPGMSLPLSMGSEIEQDVLKLEITADAIQVDQENVVALKNFEFSLADTTNGISQSIFRTLNQQRKLHPDPNFSSNLLILSDEHTPYSTLKLALASAGAAGFVDLELVIVENN